MSFKASDLVGRRRALRLLGMGPFHVVAWTRLGRRPPRSSLKAIGVLGGIGPQATMDLEARIHRVAQRLIPQHQNSGYPPLIVYYHRHPPIVLNDDSSPRLPIQADPRLLDAASRLGPWIDFLLIASNGPHLIQDQIERAAGRGVLSMIDVTLDEVRRRRWHTVGVLSFGSPMVYTRPLAASKVGYELLGDGRQAVLDGAVMRVMEGRESAESTEIARDAVRTLRDRKVDGIILGCTEIPLLLGRSALAPDLIDPLELLAEAAVKRSMS